MSDKNIKEIRNSPLREEILNTLDDLPVEEIHIPRWNRTILVKAMAVGHPRYTAFIESRGKSKEPPTEREKNMRRNVGAVIMSALDPDTGERIFNWSDANALREKHWNTVLDIAAKAFGLAGGDSPVERTALESLDFLVAYGMDNRWDTDTMELLGLIREKVMENVTDNEGDEDGDEAEDSTETDGDGDPKGDPA